MHKSKSQAQVERLQARGELIEQGIYSWYLRPSQLEIYQLLHECKRNREEAFIEAARRFGKTTSVLVYVMEWLRLMPGWICRWGLPDKDQALKIIVPEMENIQFCSPMGYRFRYLKAASVYEAPNGSTLHIEGVNHDRGMSLRGPKANIIVADEFGYWKHVQEVEEGVKPQLLTTRGQWIYSSTAPRDLGHIYYEKKRMAERKGTLISKTIYDNESLTEEDINKAAEEAGGYESPGFRREYLNEEIGDPTKRVVPEYDPQVNDLNDDHPRPSHFDLYVAGDSGADDNTAQLFAYFDFLEDCVVIEEEFVEFGLTSTQIIEASLSIEKRLWGQRAPFRRVYDADKQLLIDICAAGYSVYAPEKTDRIRAINAFRVGIKQGKIKIKERCVKLRRQLAVGQWKDERHLDFERKDDDATLKHLDAIAAAVYLNRSILKTRNPYPQHEGVSLATHYVPERILRGPSQEDEDLAGLFYSPLGDQIGR